MKMSPVWVRVSGAAVILAEKSCGTILVERSPLRVCFVWPFAVPIDLLRCFLTAVEERPGHVQKLPESMAVVQVETTGLQADWWWYVTMSCMVAISCTLLVCERL